MLRMIAIVVALIVAPLAFSHEGHDHGPGQVEAPKGGVIRSLESVHLELLTKGNTVFIYAYDENMKPDDVKKYPVSATVTLPKKKAHALALMEKGDHWEAEFDAKGAHRYSIELSIRQAGHEDKVRYTVEPKR